MADDVWFVRSGRGIFSNFKPVTWQGWVVTAAIVAAAIGVSPFALNDDWLIYTVLLVLITLTGIVVMWRTSAPAE